jgi:hypothetical protein
VRGFERVTKVDGTYVPGEIEMSNWPALLVAPSLALANLSITYALVTPSCARQSTAAMQAISFASLVLCLLFTLLAWRNRSRENAGAGYPDDAIEAKERFLSGVAVALGALSSLVIVAQWVPQWILSPCVS